MASASRSMAAVLSAPIVSVVSCASRTRRSAFAPLAHRG